MQRKILALGGFVVLSFIFNVCRANVQLIDKIDYKTLDLCNKGSSPSELTASYLDNTYGIETQLNAAYGAKGWQFVSTGFIDTLCSESEQKRLSLTISSIREFTKTVGESYSTLLNQEISFKVYLWNLDYPADGTAFWFNEQPCLAINVAKVLDYSPEQIKILLAHEFFHILQMQWSKNWTGEPLTPLQAMLFNEGWAVYASTLVCKNVDLTDLIFIDKSSNLEYFDSVKNRLLQCEVLDEENNEVLNKLFSNDSDTAKPFPPKYGYYLGYRIALEYAERHNGVQEVLRAEPADFVDAYKVFFNRCHKNACLKL